MVRSNSRGTAHFCLLEDYLPGMAHHLGLDEKPAGGGFGLRIRKSQKGHLRKTPGLSWDLMPPGHLRRFAALKTLPEAIQGLNKGIG